MAKQGVTRRPGSDPSDDSEEARAFLQRRVAVFGLVAAGLGGLFLGFRTLTGVLTRAWHLFDGSYWTHFAAAAVFLGMGLVARGRALSIAQLRVVEATGFLLACLLYAVMGVYLPLEQSPELTIVMALTFGCFARALYVPSSGSRTLLLTGSIALPVLAVTYHTWLTQYDATFLKAYPDLHTSPLAVATIKTVSTGVWWTLTTVTCTAASRVIYGLRREVASVRQLGQYTLEQKLGEGGMGVVYRARHAMLRRPTAVKLLAPGRGGDRALARFEREVQLTAKLTHPNTITVFDYGRTPDGVFYYAMELLDGATLGEVVEVDGPQPPGRVVAVLRAVASALVEAHEIGLIHRDIKPANIMLCHRGARVDVPMVLDFGLVKDLKDAGDGTGSAVESITGTPQYMAPESLESPEEVDARSDIYAVGAVGYFLVTGRHVFEGRTLVEICAQHLTAEPIAPSIRLGSAVPPALEALLLRCLAKAPTERPGSAQDLERSLGDLSREHTWDQRDALRWWEQCGDAIGARRAEKRGPASDRTVAVDLARRALSMRSDGRTAT